MTMKTWKAIFNRITLSQYNQARDYWKLARSITEEEVFALTLFFQMGVIMGKRAERARKQQKIGGTAV